MNKKVHESILYIIIRPLIKLYTKLIIRPKYEGLDNIPVNGKIILAGTHTSKLDPLVLISSTKRPIHFFAKKELWDFPKSIIFNHLGLIKVDRQTHTTDSLGEGKKYLDNDKLVLIFPEGTIEKDKGKLLPFKIGVVKLAYDTDTPIIPFTISGDYKSKNVVVKFGKQVKVKTNDLDEELDKLKNIIEDMRK